MTECRECHHLPSCRFDGNGWQCYCKCHDVADAAPELLAALKKMRLTMYSEKSQESIMADAAIAKAEGEAK